MVPDDGISALNLAVFGSLLMCASVFVGVTICYFFPNLETWECVVVGFFVGGGIGAVFAWINRMMSRRKS